MSLLAPDVHLSCLVVVADEWQKLDNTLCEVTLGSGPARSSPTGLDALDVHRMAHAETLRTNGLLSQLHTYEEPNVFFELSVCSFIAFAKLVCPQ
jgi:hypothetical protein